MNKETIYYVVSAHDDGSDAYAFRFDDKATAEKFLNTEEYDFRTRELMTEDQFLAEWTKSADCFPDEASANCEGYVWDDPNYCWLGINVADADEQ